MKREIYRNYPVGSKVRRVERQMDRGLTEDPDQRDHAQYAAGQVLRAGLYCAGDAGDGGSAGVAISQLQRVNQVGSHGRERQWYGYWPADPSIAKQAASQWMAIRGHNLQMVSKCQNHAGVLYTYREVAEYRAMERPNLGMPILRMRRRRYC